MKGLEEETKKHLEKGVILVRMRGLVYMMQSYISGGRQGKVSDGFPSKKHESAGKSKRDLCAKTHSSPVAQKNDTYSGIILVRITGLEPARVSPQTPQACASAIPPYPHINFN